MFAYAFVNSFIMAGNDQQIFIQGKCICHGLAKQFTVGTHKNNFVINPFFFQGFYGIGQGFTHHYHTCAAPILVVIHLTIFIDSPFS